MSWFTDLAGKAESLLEKVDNTAANVLQVDDKGLKDIPLDNQARPEPEQEISHTGYEPRLSRVASEGSLLRPGPSAPIKARPPSAPRPQSKVAKKDDKDDDQLFKFLNSNAPSSKPRKPSPSLSRKTPEPSLQSSVVSDRTDGKNSEAEVAIEPNNRGEPAEEDRTSHLTLDLTSDKEPSVQSMDHESPSQSAPAVHHPETDRTSNLELENKLLRKEVASLNEEMVSQLQRAKDAEKRRQMAEQQLARSEHQLSSTESIVRQLRGEEEDFSEALSAKDSQLAVLRVRIQQADQEIQDKKNQIQEFQVERERLLKDHTDSSGVHNHALDVMKTKLEEAERKMKMEEEARHKAQHESMETRGKLEIEQHSMAESLKSLQKKAHDEKTRTNEQVSALKNAKANLEASRQEMKDYKEKAGRILQAKDKVIATLREGRHGDDLIGGVTSAEFDEVCQERDALREELHLTRFRVEQLKAELQDLEHHHQSDSDIAQEKLDLLQGLLDDEKRKKEACEQEIRTHMEDIRFAQEEVQRTKTSFMGQIQERETEIQRLRNQIATKTLTSTSEAELENRVRALTENLIQKQTVIEALSTEKNSLVLQLERLEQQYRDVQASSARHVHMKSATVAFDSADDSDENTLSRVKSITSVMPSRLNDARQVKRAVNEIDKCSIRVGLFLRRYPIARLFVILYMFMLHVWVLIVLLTYKPEIHDSDPVGMPRRPRPS